MVKSRHREVEYFNANIGLLKKCVGDKTWRKLKRFIASDNSINEMEIDKFYRVIDTIPAEEWAKYLRKIRDKEYEENRSRISISRKTEEYLKWIANEGGYKSIDEMLTSIFVDNKELNENINQCLSPKVRDTENGESRKSIKKAAPKKPKVKPKPKIIPRKTDLN